MKRIIASLFILTVFCLSINAQKGSHTIELSINTTGLKLWDKEANSLPWVGKQNLLGIKYQYGISDLFKIEPAFYYKIDNETNVKYNAALTLHTDVFHEDIKEDNIKAYVNVYALTGVTYTGLDGVKDFNSRQIGGKLGVGIDLYFSNVGWFIEEGYNTFEKWFVNIGLGVRF